MKVIVLTGSPHRHGTSDVLAGSFISGLEDAGHEASRFDTAFLKIHPCIACEHCGCGVRECVWKDDMRKIYPKLIEADMVAHATPLYYHTFSAYLKAAIDRFHGIDDIIRGAGKKAVLLMAAASSESWITEGILGTYHASLRYLGWTDMGTVIAYGCARREDTEKTDYPSEAYALGRNL